MLQKVNQPCSSSLPTNVNHYSMSSVYVSIMEQFRKDETVPKRRTSYAHSVLAAGMNGMESIVHLLDNELFLASIPKDSLPSATHSLLQLLLKLFGPNPDCRRNHFFSFTETVSDYSIILDAQLLSVLRPPESGVEVSTDKWRPLVVEVGALGSVTGISKIAASVIGPLADRNVSVFCLSTNTEDYVMVKEVDLEKALACLAKRFKLTCDSCKQRDIELVKSVGRSSFCADSPVRTRAAPPPCELTSRPLVHPYICSSTLYSICGVVPSALPAIGTRLLEYMLFSERSKSTEPFFSLSVIEEDVSMVITSSDICMFPVDSLYLSDLTWRMIRIGEEPLGFDECGIVAQVSAPLALAEISTFYICTFLTDHTLVPATSAEHALELLNEIATQSTSLNGGSCTN